MQGMDDAGALVTGGLVAHELDHRGGHGGHADRGGTCPNCGALRAGAFCQECGQPVHLHRDLRGFVHDVLHGVFHFEGRFWTTLPLLAFHPGQLTRRYIDGERAKFVTPMAMFLFSVFLMFTIVSNLPGWTSTTKDAAAVNIGEGYGTTRRAIEKDLVGARAELAGLERKRIALPAGTMDPALDRKLGDARAAVRGLALAARVLPDAGNASPRLDPALKGASPATRKAAIEAWLRRKLDHFRDNPELVLYKMKSAGYKYSWALIPLSLPFIWLMFFWKRRFGLYDHAVFATYSLSFMSLLVVALTLVTSLAGGVVGGLAWTAFFLIPPVHMYKQLRYGYALGRFGAGWRTAVMLGVVAVTASLFFLLLLYLGAE